MTSAAMALRTGWAFSTAKASPPTNAFSVPNFAPCSMPLTGASIKSTPLAASFLCIFCTVVGSTVLMLITTSPAAPRR